MVSISLDSVLVQTFLFYSGVLGIKLLAMTFLTARQRMSKLAFANPEDAATRPGAKVTYNDESVERVRRAHLNDLENITPFWILGALYLTTGPSVWFATQLIRAFAIGRVLHTLFYVIMPMQPFRSIAFGIPYFVNIYMGVQVVLYYVGAM